MIGPPVLLRGEPADQVFVAAHLAQKDLLVSDRLVVGQLVMGARPELGAAERARRRRMVFVVLRSAHATRP
jgi:hypothetical protein